MGSVMGCSWIWRWIPGSDGLFYLFLFSFEKNGGGTSQSERGGVKVLCAFNFPLKRMESAFVVVKRSSLVQ